MLHSLIWTHLWTWSINLNRQESTGTNTNAAGLRTVGRLILEKNIFCLSQYLDFCASIMLTRTYSKPVYSSLRSLLIFLQETCQTPFPIYAVVYNIKNGNLRVFCNVTLLLGCHTVQLGIAGDTQFRN